MATLSASWSDSTGANGGVELICARSLLKSRCVTVEFASLTDAETYSAGPGLITVMWEQATADTGVGGWKITDRDTGALEWDSGGAAQAGTLWCFYGTFAGGV